MKELLKGSITLLVAFFYSLFVAKFPNFPLDQSSVLAVILWGVGFAIGGWQMKTLHFKIKTQRFHN